MDLPSLYAGDFSLFDNVENVTLVPLGDDGQPQYGSAVPNVKAVRGRVDGRAMQLHSTVSLAPTDIVMHLWASTMGSQPAVEVIDGNGVHYTILSAVFDSVVYNCALRQMPAIS